MGERRPLPRRAAPASPLSQHGRRLCPIGEQLQLGGGERDPAACDRPASRGRRQQCELGRARRRKRAGPRVWRDGAEEQRCRRRRHKPTHCPRPPGAGPLPRRRVSPDRPAARRPAARARRDLAPDPPRHRCRADARPRPYAGRRGTARPRLSRPLLHRLGRVRAHSRRARMPPGPPRSAASRRPTSSRWPGAAPAAAR